MKEYQLKILARYCPEILERILRVIRHRQFKLEKVNMRRKFKEKKIIVTIIVNSDRKISLLYNQLMKLIDIYQVIIK